uniref:STIL N-terminal domain-containing protein n=1 Tax=Echeneis naucrates TaxID=173247 RepID=A0A665TZF5_ECHNA
MTDELVSVDVSPFFSRSSNSLTPLSFSKSRSALWQSSPAGEMLRLQNLRVVLLEKPLCLAQRHVRHRNKPNLQCFFLGSVSVDSDEEGITITLDRFDPGRDQTRSSGRVPTALLPGDILVPCLFSTQAETSPDTVVHSEAELHYCFKALQQFVSSRQPVELCQLFKVRGQVVWTQQSDAAVFGFHWSAVYPFFRVDVQPVQAVPIIPTALLRSLTSINWRLQQFLTMDQTKKLLLLLESDPKASNLPLVGLWVSGVSHLSNPQVMSWCLRFLFSSALQNRVLSESGCFLLVLFASTHRAPQFFQCLSNSVRSDVAQVPDDEDLMWRNVISVHPVNVSSVSSVPPPQAQVFLSVIRTLESRTKTCLHDHPQVLTLQLRG